MSGPNIAKNYDFLVALEDVTLRLGDRLVFRRTNWRMRPGQNWAVIGPNGSGKSLLAAALAGHGLLAEGEIHHHFDESGSTSVSGRRVTSPEEAIAYVSPQLHREVIERESSFYQSRWHSGLGEGQMTVSDYLSQAHLEGTNPFEVEARLRSPRVFRRERNEWMDRLGLEPLRRRKLIYLSNGEMRKVLLAGALLQSPGLLVLDDPFAGLDVRTREGLEQAIGELMRAGQRVLLITSRLDEIPAETTHLLLVQNYRVVAQGTKPAVLRHPLTKRMQAQPASARPPVPVQAKRSREVPAATSRALVEMRNVTVRYGRKLILRQIDWTMRSGEHWALVGPNGSGKSTLLSLIQVDNPQAYAQDIRLFGVSPDSTQALWQARRRLGWVSPELHLHYPRQWPCLDVVCSGFTDALGLYQRPTSRQRSLARQWLRKLRLARFAATAFGALSTGEQRTILLARAMVKSPRLLILDEPCQGLDSSHRQLILHAVDRVVRDTGAGLIFVTHHRREMPHCITHLLQLRAGRIVRQGRLESPRSRNGDRQKN